MLIEPRRWECDCDQCGKEFDVDELECDGWIHEIEEFVRAIGQEGWIYDFDRDLVFCCKECEERYIRENTDDDCEAK